jgi:hypothetical protein
MIEAMMIVVWLGITMMLPLIIGVFIVLEAIELISNVERKKNK